MTENSREQQLNTEARDLFDSTAKETAARELVRQLEAQDAGNEYLGRTLAFAGLGDAIIRSASAISNLADQGDVGSAYVLARTIVEQTITLAYLTVCPKDEFTRWLQYGSQKQYRLLDRKKGAGGLEITLTKVGLPDPVDVPGLAEALLEFTGKSGKESTHWTKKNLVEMINVVQDVFPKRNIAMMLLWGLATCYEIGAEVQHATAIGATIQHLDGLGDSHSHQMMILMAAATGRATHSRVRRS